MSVYNIVFQSNSIDGWFSAYLTSQLAVESKDDLVYFHPIDARNQYTWPEPEKLVPLSANKAGDTEKNKAFCYFIDCTINNSEYLVDICKDFEIVIIDNNPTAATIDPKGKILVKHNPKLTTISQVWQHFQMTYSSMPEWVQQVDRIESWSMKHTDSAIRENLLEICRLPTSGRLLEAIHKTAYYLATFKDSGKADLFLAEGEEKLKTKISGFAPLLASTQHIELTMSDCAKWGFPLVWDTKIILYVDSTGFAPDSSELAACAFEKFTIDTGSKPDCFINFRLRTHSNGEAYYVYSARVSPTSDFNLVEDGSPFKGFEKSAGAVISVFEDRLPLIRK